MSRNNESRSKFKEFLNIHAKSCGLTRVDSRNVFQMGDLKIGYALGSTNNSIRQLYEDVDGMVINDAFYPRAKLRTTTKTKITPYTKLTALNAFFNPADGVFFSPHEYALAKLENKVAAYKNKLGVGT